MKNSPLNLIFFPIVPFKFAVVFILSSFQSMSGALTVSRERAEFVDSSEVEVRIESFEDFVPVSVGTTQNFRQTFFELSGFTVTSTSPELSIHNQFRGNFPTSTGGDNYLIHLGGAGHFLSFEFQTPILAFGTYIWNFNGFSSRLEILTALDMDVDEILVWRAENPENEQLEFLGVISDTPFDRILLWQNNSVSYGLDEIVFFPVPEPSTSLFFGLGFGSLLLRRRRLLNFAS